MAITLSTLAEGEIYGTRSALPVGFQAGSVAEYLSTIDVDLKIWIGDKTTAKPSTATYSLSLDTDLFGSTLQYYDFDISELVREYIDIDNFSYPTTYESDWAAWVEVDWTATNSASGSFTDAIEFICTNGFRAYESDTLALSTYYFPSNINIPSGNSYYVTALDNGVTGATRVADTIEIVYDDATSNSTSFGVAGTTTASLFKTLSIAFTADQNSGTVTLKNGATEVASFTVTKVCKTKYTPKQIGYVNQIGVVDYAYGFGRNEKTQAVDRKIYKPVLNANYDNGNAQYRTLNANGKRTLTINTDFVPEEYGEKVSDLILSEYVFLADGNTADGVTVRAITPQDAQQTLKQSVNDLVNYELNFSYAYDHINSVR